MLWLNIDPEQPGQHIYGSDVMPVGEGEWISFDSAVAIINAHNERQARDEQCGPDWVRDVCMELERARAKFPGTELLTTAFAEEAGELVKAILDNYHGKASDIYIEAIQTIAMAVRLIEEGDPLHRLAPIVDTRTIWKSQNVGWSEAPFTRPTMVGPMSEKAASAIVKASQCGKTGLMMAQLESLLEPYIPSECHGKFTGPAPNITPDYPGEGSAYMDEPSPGAKVKYIGEFGALGDEMTPEEWANRPFPGSSPSLAAKVQEIQKSAKSAPGSDAEHPPEGYRLAVEGDALDRNTCLVWSFNKGPWEDCVMSGEVPTKFTELGGWHPFAVPLSSASSPVIQAGAVEAHNRALVDSGVVEMDGPASDIPDLAYIWIETERLRELEAELDKCKELLSAAVRAKGDAEGRAALAERRLANLLANIQSSLMVAQFDPTTSEMSKP